MGGWRDKERARDAICCAIEHSHMLSNDQTTDLAHRTDKPRPDPLHYRSQNGPLSPSFHSEVDSGLGTNAATFSRTKCRGKPKTACGATFCTFTIYREDASGSLCGHPMEFSNVLKCSLHILFTSPWSKPDPRLPMVQRAPVLQCSATTE